MGLLEISNEHVAKVQSENLLNGGERKETANASKRDAPLCQRRPSSVESASASVLNVHSEQRLRRADYDGTRT